MNGMGSRTPRICWPLSRGGMHSGPSSSLTLQAAVGTAPVLTDLAVGLGAVVYVDHEIAASRPLRYLALPWCRSRAGCRPPTTGKVSPKGGWCPPTR